MNTEKAASLTRRIANIISQMANETNQEALAQMQADVQELVRLLTVLVSQ